MKRMAHFGVSKSDESRRLNHEQRLIERHMWFIEAQTRIGEQKSKSKLEVVTMFHFTNILKK